MTIELEVLPAAIEYGVGIIPWSPLQGGLLGGVLRKEREGRRRQAGRAREAIERNREQIEAYEIFCEELGEEPATVALAWLLHQRRGDGADRRAAHARPARRRAARARPSGWTRTHSPGSTPSSLATSRRPSTTPGDPLDIYSEGVNFAVCPDDGAHLRPGSPTAAPAAGLSHLRQAI